MPSDPICECGRPITRRGASGMAPPKCRTCMREWAKAQLERDERETPVPG